VLDQQKSEIVSNCQFSKKVHYVKQNIYFTRFDVDIAVALPLPIRNG